jgi:hypothetical protein
VCRPTNEMRATHENACLNAIRPPRDEAAVCNPCRDTFASGVCRRVAPIRAILNKIRIESCSTASLKQAPKSIRHHCRRAVEAPLLPKLRSGALVGDMCVLFMQHSPEKDRSCR